MKSTRDSVHKFFGDLATHIRIEAYKLTDIKFKNDYLCDGISKDVLTYLIESQGKSGSTVIALLSLATKINTTRHHVEKRVYMLAQFAIIKVIYDWRNDGSSKRTSSQITVNPLVLKILQPKTRHSEIRIVIKNLVGLGLNRLYIDGQKVQGFNDDCEFGQLEVAPLDQPIRSAGDQIMELLAESDQLEQQKVEDRELWAARDRAFLLGCSSVWVHGQSRMGRGIAKPNWLGETSTLAPAAKKERQELIKTFHQYGGAVTAIAWSIFTHYEVKMDSKGNMEFTKDMPHRQFVSDDKKPSQFVKNFNSQINDPYFKLRATEDYQKYRGKLMEFYKDSFDVPPEDGSLPSEKIGYVLGSSGVSLDSLEVGNV